MSFTEFTPDFLNTPEGVNELNRILNVLNINIAGDTDGVRVFKGFGSPEGEVVANVGAIYLRLDGGTDTTLYAKESGVGNTGWVATSNVSLPLSLANGGTGQALTDPDADRILFWDDSEGKTAWLTPNTDLEIDGTNLNVTSGIIFAAGDVLVVSDVEEEASTGSTTYNKVKELYIKYGGVIRVKWRMQISTGTIQDDAISQLRLNDVAVSGTEQTLDGDSGAWAQYSEDISVDAGDLLQVWAHVATAADGRSVNIDNLQVFSDVAIYEDIINLQSDGTTREVVYAGAGYTYTVADVVLGV